jgi:hypothetical protein
MQVGRRAYPSSFQEGSAACLCVSDRKAALLSAALGHCAVKLITLQFIPLPSYPIGGELRQTLPNAVLNENPARVD